MARLLCLRTASAILAPPLWAVSSAVEHYLDMVGVTGSIPVLPTSYRSGTGNRTSPRHFAAALRCVRHSGDARRGLVLARAHQVVERVDLRFVALHVFGKQRGDVLGGGLGRGSVDDSLQQVIEATHDAARKCDHDEAKPCQLP